jgi:hypothetical protein
MKSMTAACARVRALASFQPQQAGVRYFAPSASPSPAFFVPPQPKKDDNQGNSGGIQSETAHARDGCGPRRDLPPTTARRFFCFASASM